MQKEYRGIAKAAVKSGFYGLQNIQLVFNEINPPCKKSVLKLQAKVSDGSFSGNPYL